MSNQAELLTADEHEAVRLAGELYTFIASRIVGHGPTREDDLRELRAHIHGVQLSVRAQAAGRQHPELYRLLGETVTDQPMER